MTFKGTVALFVLVSGYVLDEAEYSAFESMLNSSIVSSSRLEITLLSPTYLLECNDFGNFFLKLG